MRLLASPNLAMRTPVSGTPVPTCAIVLIRYSGIQPASKTRAGRTNRRRGSLTLAGEGLPLFYFHLTVFFVLSLYYMACVGLLGRLYYDGKSFWKHSILLERMVGPKVRSNF